MPYELYQNDALWREKEPRISITRLGRFHFNASATRQLQADEVRKVQLLWDKDKKRIAMKIVGDDAKYTREIHYFKAGKGSGFAAKAFLTYIGYDARKSVSLPFTWNGKKLIEFSIDKAELRDTYDRSHPHA